MIDSGTVSMDCLKLYEDSEPVQTRDEYSESCGWYLKLYTEDNIPRRHIYCSHKDEKRKKYTDRLMVHPFKAYACLQEKGRQSIIY